MAVVSGAGAFPDEGRIGELVEQMRLRCAHAQQLKQLPSQQQTPATSQQVMCFHAIGMWLVNVGPSIEAHGRQ